MCMAEGLKLNEWYLYLDTSTSELVRFYLKRMFVRSQYPQILKKKQTFSLLMINVPFCLPELGLNRGSTESSALALRIDDAK